MGEVLTSCSKLPCLHFIKSLNHQGQKRPLNHPVLPSICLSVVQEFVEGLKFIRIHRQEVQHIKVKPSTVLFCLKDGTAPLWIASQMGHSEVVRVMLLRGAERDAARNVSSTAALCRFFLVCFQAAKLSEGRPSVPRAYSVCQVVTFSHGLCFSMCVWNKGLEIES